MKLFKSKSGFTLIELLVVIGILAVLAAIAIPSVAGLIDRANVSADKTNANEMTNAIERFTSEYELYCQDIASGVIDANTTDFDAAQGRVYNVTQVKTRSEIETLEVAQGASVPETQLAIYRDTKYPVNAVTLKAIVENYTKTSSATFDPKQSDMHFWYSPACGVVVIATPDSSVADKNDLIISGMDAKGRELDDTNEIWIDITDTQNVQAATPNNGQAGIPFGRTYSTGIMWDDGDSNVGDDYLIYEYKFNENGTVYWRFFGHHGDGREEEHVSNPLSTETMELTTRMGANGVWTSETKENGAPITYTIQNGNPHIVTMSADLTGEELTIVFSDDFTQFEIDGLVFKLQ